ncbi:MAG TPA: hypothetical protein VL287_12450 [Gemmatimonadales bacterium]|nr:hypothetical protein [Gemmatimonadales bacterium]
MIGAFRRRWWAAFAFAASLAGCSEQLTQPGQCPELCPGGLPQGEEQILTALPNQDSTFTGYTARSSGTVMLVGSGAPTLADTSYGVIVFNPRADSVNFRDTLRAYAVDSVRISLLTAHDTATRHVLVQLYRLPSSLDTNTLTFDGIRPFFVPANFIASQQLRDTAPGDTVRILLKGAPLDQVALAPADKGVLVMGVAVIGDTPTAGRIGNNRAVLPPEFLSYLKPIVANPATVAITLDAKFADYVSRQIPVINPALLTVGGVPSSRVLIRFPWPARLSDSATIVRATLELVPAEPVVGVRNQTGTLNVQGLAADFGAKSPIEPSSLGSLLLPFNTTDTIRVEIANVVRFWQGGLRPPAMFLSIVPEVETFSRGVFGSTRTGAPPRIRINFLPRFPFSEP